MTEARRPRVRPRLGWLPALCLLLPTLLTAGACGSPAPPRHLLLVVFDTLRADRTSLYGYERPTTPFLEGLAPELLRFANAKAPAPWTVPSHASMFTGLWPAEHRAQWGRIPLAGSFQTLAETLGAAGFCTAGLSANDLVGPSSNLHQGFDRFERVRGPWPERSAAILERVPEVLAEAEAEGCRLFLFLNLMDTHIPYNARPHGAEFGADGPGPVRNAAVKWAVNAGRRSLSAEERRLQEAAYDAAVRQADDLARRIVGLYREAGLLDRSLVVFTSDHGEGLGAQPEVGHTISLWEEQLAVPLVVRLPRGERGGEVVEAPTSLTALKPSLLDWLGVERPPWLAGVADLEQVTPEVRADYRSYFAEHNRGTNARMAKEYPELARRVRHQHVLYCGHHKLVVDAAGGRRFYDIAADPHERSDLAGADSEELTRCLGRYERLAAAGRFTPFAEVPGEEGEEALPVDLEALRALGYIE